MVSKVHKRAPSPSNKLQSLRSISRSHSRSKTSIILDASKYIQDLKRKVEQMSEEIIAAAPQNPFPLQVKVEAGEEGFVIKMSSQRSCSGLLVFVLEAFEELGLDVHQTRVSCSNHFLLEAVGTIHDNDEKDADVVKEAVLKAIENWSEVTHQELIN